MGERVRLICSACLFRTEALTADPWFSKSLSDDGNTVVTECSNCASDLGCDYLQPGSDGFKTTHFIDGPAPEPTP